MKKVMFLFLVILCASFVSATEYPYEISRLRGYVGDKMIPSTDFSESDSDVITLNPGDILEIQATLRNTNDTRNIEDVIIKFIITEIDDGDDIEEETAEFTIQPLKTKKDSLYITIPALADEDEYDARMIISGIWFNGSQNVEVRKTYNYTIEIERFYNTTTSNILTDTLNNVTKTFSEVDKKVTSTNTKLDELITTNRNCPGQLEIKEKAFQECDNKRLSIEQELDLSESNLAICSAQKDVRITAEQCNVQSDQKFLTSKNEIVNNTRLFDFIICACIIGIIWFKYIRKSKISSPGGDRRQQADFPDMRR